MPRFTIDLWMDGYESDAEMKAACVEFISDQLDNSACSVTIIKIEDDEDE